MHSSPDQECSPSARRRRGGGSKCRMRWWKWDGTRGEGKKRSQGEEERDDDDDNSRYTDDKAVKWGSRMIMRLKQTRGDLLNSLNCFNDMQRFPGATFVRSDNRQWYYEMHMYQPIHESLYAWANGHLMGVYLPLCLSFCLSVRTGIDT